MMMKPKMPKGLSALLAPMFCAGMLAAPAYAVTTQPIAKASLVFGEESGVIAVEAEHFFEQTGTDKRAWYLTTAKSAPKASNDADGPHVVGSAGGAYLEILPDTRHHHGHKLIQGVNFSPTPGKLGVLSYKVNVETPGRWYVWVRAHSTGSEDNGLHVGLDGEWPASGQRLQWCEGKKTWRWDSKQRTEKTHCGEAGKIFLDIKEAGEHVIQFSMREDGFEFDKWAMTLDKNFSRPENVGPVSVIKKGNAPRAFVVPSGYSDPVLVKKKALVKSTGDYAAPAAVLVAKALTMGASDFPAEGTGFYVDKGRWMAINPDKNKTATTSSSFPFAEGMFNITLLAVGENDGGSSYSVVINDVKIGDHTAPLSKGMFEEGAKYHRTWKNIGVSPGDVVTVTSTIASADGMEYSRARWAGLKFAPADAKTRRANKTFLAAVGKKAASVPTVAAKPRKTGPALVLPRSPNGDGKATVSGELKEWHKVTLDIAGPYAHENDNQPNPFTDYRMTATFTHESGSPSYQVPGYFAADGNAANSSAKSGTTWRAHLSPDKAGTWKYSVSFKRGKNTALSVGESGKAMAKFSSAKGSFKVGKTDKSGVDYRGKGRLQYVGKRYLQFAGNGEYFIKAGADAPETFLAYADFDDTVGGNLKKAPIKTWSKHVQDWNAGDPTWKGGRGKGMIGALNYLSGKGCNVFSFLPYNAGGDGDNVWPFVSRNEKFHYDCSKLDQWGVIFDHATLKGLYLHFKLQETEMDDNRRGHKSASDRTVPTSLDGGKLGPERKLYCREIIARFGHALALNWNLGEENTQSTQEQQDMIDYIAAVDAYDHNIVLHTYPDQQDKIYKPLIGDKSKLTGLSLQNSAVKDTHWQTVKWVEASTKAGKPWIVAFDESGTASHGQVPDWGYQGFKGMDASGAEVYDQHVVRNQTLWGTLMGGGGGVEYYFGYKLPENDIICEDWRSRDQSWEDCARALNFFREHVPIAETMPADDLIGAGQKDNSKYCLAKKGSVYVVYLNNGGTTDLDLSDAKGKLGIKWFNPRVGGSLVDGSVKSVKGGSRVSIGNPPSDNDKDWVALIQK
ncbi:DUF5060 domain-containing protein [Verrucomicrobia bacterium]|nr:DUF5060 domain-containing protein [Verrucomicrobiota bacterium]